jgi:hypothetical protein
MSRLFDDPDRFLADLACMLRLKAAYDSFVVGAGSRTGLKDSTKDFINALVEWHERTGYQNVWEWPGLRKSLHQKWPGPL